MTIDTSAPRPDSLTSRSVSRRGFLAGLPFAALALAACKGSTSTTTSSAQSAGSTSGGSSTAVASAPSTSASASGPAAGSVAALALAFQASLSSTQRSTLDQKYSLANAELWSNLPQSLLGGSGGGPGGGGPGGGGGSKGPRLGISLDTLNDTQLASFQTLLKAATGSTPGLGYAEIQQHLNADDYLSAHGGGSEYGRANFYIAFLGTPADTGTWEFQFGGHHLAVANTYNNGSLIGATPSFRGIEPDGVFSQNGSSNQPMAVKEAAFKALLSSLTTAQLAQAELSSVFSDLLLGAGKDWAFPTTHEGLKVSTLDAAGKKLVLTAIAAYVNDIADIDAKKILARYQSQLNDTYVAYSGTTALTEQNDYVRIDGPAVWIEFSMQHGIVLSGNHPHSVWRDRTADYGGTKN